MRPNRIVDFFVLVFFAVIGPEMVMALPTENRCFSPSVKTIRVFRQGYEMSPPVIQLNSDEKLDISFDDLDPDLKRYRFTVFHCEADWKPSVELSVSDYLDGYREEEINQYAYSYNTTVKYTHFSVLFPTDNMKPKISGNYMLVVYEEDTTSVVFTRRFMVVEPSSVASDGKVVQSSRMADRFARQQVDFEVKLNGFELTDVSREIRVVVQQNGRWDNVLLLGKPRFVHAGELDYRYDESICFSGGNQFRSFDIKSLQYQTERVAHISYDTIFQVELLPDPLRSFKNYVLEKDLNGAFFIKNEDHAENSNTEADYALVHFFLPYPALLTSGSFYVLGGMAGWEFGDGNRMKFNINRKGYELNMLLKQGLYNYLYVLKENTRKEADESLIEGAHWETENDFTILVYYHGPGLPCDRLIAVNYINSLKQ